MRQNRTFQLSLNRTYQLSRDKIVHTDDSTGERHIADVKTETGMVLEFQNSPISDAEVQSRERFYRKMMWIVNASSFRNDFTLVKGIPDPNSSFGERFLRGVGISPGGSGYREIFPNVDFWTGDDLATEIERNFKEHVSAALKFPSFRRLNCPTPRRFRAPHPAFG